MRQVANSPLILRERHTHFQLLVARGHTVTGRVHSWNEVAPDTYAFYRSTRTFCLMATQAVSVQTG